MTDATTAPPATPAVALAQRTSWGQMLVVGLIIGLTLYFMLFAFLLADALFLERNLIIKPIQNGSPALMKFIATIYYPEIVLLKLFRVIPG